MNPSAGSPDEIFFAALEIASPEARAAYLDEVCGTDLELRRRIERLLDAQPRVGRFLDAPAVGPTLTFGPPPGLEAPGTVIGRYTLLEPIGEGGMGVVYRAQQKHPVRREVALKIIKPGMDTRQVIARFEVERQALALMDHSNIARVLDAGATEGGRPYFVMELVKGVPITDYCDAQHLSLDDRLDLFVRVCQAVQHAHQKGIIHRDLKPSNIIVTLRDGVPVPKVIDFGIAKATGQSLTDKTLFTAFAQLVGTPMYMSPEQASKSGIDVDTRSDIYSLGVLLYELLTGTTPFDAATFRTAALGEIQRIIREQEPPRPSTRLSTLGDTLTTVAVNRQADPRKLPHAIRGELDWIVMKALEKDRARRYATAADFAADLMRHRTDQPVEACPPTAWYRLAKYVRRHRAALATAALVAGALLVGLAVSVAMAIRASDAERQTAVALSKVRESLVDADRQRARARRAVDDMYTQVAAKWLSRDDALTPLQREFLEKALAFYEEFARERADDPEARAEVAKAAARVGEIRSQLGQTAGALESHRQALETFRKLAAEFPDRPDYRRGVADSLRAVGRLFETLGRSGDAEPAYREALALRQALAQASGAPDDRASFADMLQLLGAFLHATRRSADGEKALLQARDLLIRLVDEVPARAADLGLLAATEGRLAHLYLWTERKPAAEAPSRRALELRQKLAEADPTEPELRLGLANAYYDLGNYWRLTFKHAAAASEFRRALAIAEKLATDQPDRPKYRSVLSQTLRMLGEELRPMGRDDEAEQVLRRSREISEKLAADFPDVPGYRLSLASGLGQLGAVRAQLGRTRDARVSFERAYEINKSLATAHPDLYFYGRNLAAHCYLAAVNYATMTGRDGRDDARARELAREAVAIEPEEAGFWKGLALAEYRVGDLDAALKAETKALDLRQSRGYCYDWLLLALIHLGRDDYEQARPWIMQAVPGCVRETRLAGEPDLIRLFRENEARVRALFPTDPEGVLSLLESELERQRRAGGPEAPSLSWLMYRVADQRAVVGRYDDAIALFEESLRLTPDRFDKGTKMFSQWFPLAVLTLRKDDRDGYRARCNGLRGRFSGTTGPGVAEQVARICCAVPSAVNDPDELLAFARCAGADAEQPYCLLAAGAVEFRAGRCASAVEVLTRSVAQARDSSERAQAALFLALAHSRLGQAEAARDALAEADRALAEDPVPEPDPQTLLLVWPWRERMLAQILRSEAAVEFGSAGPRTGGLGETEAIDAYRELGKTHVAARDWDRAAVALREAIRRKPDDPATHLELAKVLRQKGPRDEAEAEYREAVRLRPDDPDIHLEFGNFHHDTGARDAELAEYREAARLHTDGLPWARAELVWILAISPEPRLRNPAEALEHARKAVELTQGQHPAFQATLALAAYRSGLYEEALAALDKAKALDGKEDATTLFLMAAIHGQKGEQEQARPWFDKAVAWMKAQSYQGMYHGLLWSEAAALLGQPGPDGR